MCPLLVKQVIWRNTFDLYLLSTRQVFKNLILFLQKHSNTQFSQLVDIVAFDTPGKKYRFSIVYILYSLKFNTRIFIQIQTNETHLIQSITPMYTAAGWMEREIWDFFGIFFLGHHDLRRILTDYGFNQNPLRKDFPLTGFMEIYYNDEQKRIVFEPVELAQEYRVFTLKNSWTKDLGDYDSRNVITE